jgi:hypothetical protein
MKYAALPSKKISWTREDPRKLHRSLRSRVDASVQQRAYSGLR